MPSPAQRKKATRKKVASHRAKLRAQGLRPIQIWVPDTRSPEFAKEARRQSRLVARSPHAAEDHQTVNAENLVKKKAAIMITDKEAGEKLVEEILRLANNKPEQELLKENIGKLAITDADEKIATEILNTLNG